MATGGGFGTRKLHTNAEEVLFDVTRPCLLNGIPDLASRADLADRAIIVHLPVISGSERRFERELWDDFDQAAPAILGALLNGVSCAMANLEAVTLTERPRLADFARWITAAETSFGWAQGSFLETYAENRNRATLAAIESNPVAEATLALARAETTWGGTATELHAMLRNRFPLTCADAMTFPKDAARLASDLRRVQPLLRNQGISLTFARHGKEGVRQIVLECA
ncbi:DNA-binding protein [Aliiruegeria haliotis]|nr:DNA-binding protein [Aliiruegeria haliotis]